MLKLNLTNAALNFLDDLPAKQFKQIVNTLFALLKNPMPQDAKQLKGYSYRRVDCGEYRIIYQINDNDELQVILIGKRNDDDVYKKLNRMT